MLGSAAAVATAEATAAPPMEYVIPNSTPQKYYQIPEGLKSIRPKKKVAIVFGYVGECYCGLQWNHLPEYPTVEESLMRALFETGMISEVNYSNVKVQQLLNFERASRTDKGVHALRNVISVALMLPYSPAYVAQQQQQQDGTDATRAKHERAEEDGDGDDDGGVQKFSTEEAKRLLNAALPPDIHVYAAVPVTRSFNAYLNCGGRRYEYYLPTFALMSQSSYSSQYYPPSLASAQPTLQETGFRPGKYGRPKPAASAALPLTDEEEEARRRRRAQSGRKSKGHYPKRKKHRTATAAPEKTTATATDGHEEHGPPSTSSSLQKAEEVDAVVAAKAEGGEENDDDSADSDAEVEEVLQRLQAELAANQARLGDEATSDAAATQTSGSFVDKYATHFHDGLFETMILYRKIPSDAMRLVGDYRLPPSQLDHIRDLFHQYEGTHCYHNFTPGGRSTDASCHRFIRSVSVSDPFVVAPQDPLLRECIDKWSMSRFNSPDDGVMATYEEWVEESCRASSRGGAGTTAVQSTTDASSSAHSPKPVITPETDAALRQRVRSHLEDVYPNGIEVVRIELDGQSFMLNQIRKMIGAVICIAAAGLPVSTLREVLLSKRVRRGIPMAPANGLFLSTLDFAGYNRRLHRIQDGGGNGIGKGALDMEEGIPAAEVEEQRRRIVAVVLRNEMAEDIMGRWMRSLRHVMRLAWQHDIL